METYELIFTIAIGLAILLFGYKLKKLAFFVVWFLIGYMLMVQYLLPFINENAPVIAESSIYQFLLPIAGGVLMAMLGFFIEKLCVSLTVFALVMMIATNYFGTEIPVLVIGAVIGVLLGGFAVRMIKPATILVTSGIGAYALTIAIFALVTGLKEIPSPIPLYYALILLVILALGASFQFSTTKHMS